MLRPFRCTISTGGEVYSVQQEAQAQSPGGHHTWDHWILRFLFNENYLLPPFQIQSEPVKCSTMDSDSLPKTLNQYLLVNNVKGSTKDPAEPRLTVSPLSTAWRTSLLTHSSAVSVLCPEQMLTEEALVGCYWTCDQQGAKLQSYSRVLDTKLRFETGL